MHRQKTGIFVSAAGALAALIASIGSAHAGGFELREHSAYGQGASFAGIAAGGSLSSLYWNPASLTQFGGIQTELVGSGLFPYAAHTVLPGSTLAGSGGASNSVDDALVPSGYFSYQVNPKLWLGLSINAPFGLSVSFPNNWAGQNYAGDTSLKSYNATPTIAYRINDWISIGAGVQIEYASANLKTGLAAAGAFSVADIEGKGWGYGFTAGVTLTPTPTTTIGIGYRSFLDQDIDGSLSVLGPIALAPGSTLGSVSTTLKLPDTVSLGIRQRISPQWTLLGTVEWSNWSRIGTSIITQPNGAAATIAGNAVKLPFQYQDGWFFSGGAEYQWNDRLSLRSGIGYEISPITDDVRTPRLPDNDRFWLSVGLSYQLLKGLTADLAYSHLFFRDTPINIGPNNPWFTGNTYIANVDSHIDIVSVGLKYRWDEPAAPIKSKLYTK